MYYTSSGGNVLHAWGAGGERLLFYSSTSGNWLISKVSQANWGNTGKEALAGCVAAGSQVIR
jgi:hypothetical protein